MKEFLLIAAGLLSVTAAVLFDRRKKKKNLGHLDYISSQLGLNAAISEERIPFTAYGNELWGTYQGIPLKIRTETRGIGKQSELFTFLTLTAGLKSAPFTVSRKGFQSSSNASVLQGHDKAFDAKFSVTGEDRELLNCIFSEEIRDELKKSFYFLNNRIHYDGHAFTYEEKYLIDQVKKADRFIFVIRLCAKITVRGRSCISSA
jgi:hypothetical protein